MDEKYFGFALVLVIALAGGFFWSRSKLAISRLELGMARLELEIKLSLAKQAGQVQSVIERKMPVNEVSVTLAVNKFDDGVVVARDVSVTYEELTSLQVEHWLESRGLVMQPKAVDFKFEAKP